MGRAVMATDEATAAGGRLSRAAVFGLGSATAGVIAATTLWAGPIEDQLPVMPAFLGWILAPFLLLVAFTMGYVEWKVESLRRQVAIGMVFGIIGCIASFGPLLMGD